MSQLDKKSEELAELRKQELGELELEVIGNYTIADAIREGCKVSEQAEGWGDGLTACAFTAAVIAAKSRGYM